MSRLLLVDDDIEVLNINMKYFHQLNYEVKIAKDAEAAINIIETFRPECIVMDVMMPGIDGFTACKKIRSKYDIPIIFLTGKNDEDDKINGLLIGGDDYMVKPYSLRELDARIKVQIRKHQRVQNSNSNIIEFPPLSIDLVKHKAFYQLEEIPLSNKEFDFLCLLASYPNQIFTFEDIGNKLSGGYIEADRKTIMVTASRLRKKLDYYPGISDFVQTVWSKGYQFVPKVKL